MSLFRRRKKFVINEPDPSYNVIYLGNVLTVLAKGDNCTDKPLSLIWRTYCSRTRPDIPMTLSVTKSGLQGVTKQQGMTEYWAHRITYCASPSQQYPRLFCWIYKHEGKKMKPELRCHAVLCKKPEHPQAIALLLHEKISSALRDYKREKIARQNIRLCGTVAGYPTVPQRKILLSTGGQNFRPPMNRSKSAPRLHSIEECGQEEDEPTEEENGSEMTASALVDSIQEEEDEEEEEVDEEDGIGDEMNVVRSYFVPGTPREVEFRYPSPFRVDLEIGNDVEKLRIDERVQRCILRRPNSTSTDNTSEADSISDESGYHDEKSSLEEDDDVIIDDAQQLTERFSQITAL